MLQFNFFIDWTGPAKFSAERNPVMSTIHPGQRNGWHFEVQIWRIGWFVIWG